MPYSFPPDLRQFVASRIASGQYADEDELLRDACRALSEEEGELVAIQEAVDRYKDGERGVPLDEAIERVRQRAERRPDG